MNARIQNIECHETNTIKMRIFIGVLCLNGIQVSNKFCRQFITVNGVKELIWVDWSWAVLRCGSSSINLRFNSKFTHSGHGQSCLESVQHWCGADCWFTIHLWYTHKLKSVENSFSCFSSSLHGQRIKVSVSAFFLSFVWFYEPSFIVTRNTHTHTNIHTWYVCYSDINRH